MKESFKEVKRHKPETYCMNAYAVLGCLSCEYSGCELGGPQMNREGAYCPKEGVTVTYSALNEVIETGQDKVED